MWNNYLGQAMSQLHSPYSSFGNLAGIGQAIPIPNNSKTPVLQLLTKLKEDKEAEIERLQKDLKKIDEAIEEVKKRPNTVALIDRLRAWGIV